MSIKARIKSFIHSKHMLKGIFTASFLESTIVPIPLEAILVPLMQKRREKLWIIATVTTLGCMLGALLGYAVGYYLFDIARDFIMDYITSEEQFEIFQGTMKDQGFWLIFSTGITPVPLQLAMLAAGVSQYSLILYMIAVTSSRIIRYFGLALLVYYFGDKTEALIRQYKFQAIVIGVLAVLLFLGLQFWPSA
ncbi:DedA family protein BAL199 [Glaciecola punicea ACAM 611]|uniref:DedA family protein BAL199 n=1 Tax=Glaciecola punicea ACAM 611 TaxID=1121923 RepID=H5TAL2_9ALTE|nr:VTT domain-containing protein [Glaciecola punicea]GAB55339.1 DedA family protein BAL199 [Glaciecola punicea ACAM 611]